MFRHLTAVALAAMTAMHALNVTCTAWVLTTAPHAAAKTAISLPVSCRHSRYLSAAHTLSACAEQPARCANVSQSAEATPVRYQRRLGHLTPVAAFALAAAFAFAAAFAAHAAAAAAAARAIAVQPPNVRDGAADGRGVARAPCQQ